MVAVFDVNESRIRSLITVSAANVYLGGAALRLVCANVDPITVNKNTETSAAVTNLLFVFISRAPASVTPLAKSG